MDRASALGLALGSLIALSGCASGAQCGDTRDATGRPVIMCPPREAAVCDQPGEDARFVRDELVGYVLEGGDFALCTPEGEPTCPAGTEGPVRCLLDPEL